MEPCQGEFGSFLLHPIGAAHGIDPQPSLQQQPLSNLDPILEILGQASPTHHLDLARGIIDPQPIKANGHLRDRRLVVLGVAKLGRLQHLHLKQAVIHTHTHGLEQPS